MLLWNNMRHVTNNELCWWCKVPFISVDYSACGQALQHPSPPFLGLLFEFVLRYVFLGDLKTLWNCGWSFWIKSSGSEACQRRRVVLQSVDCVVPPAVCGLCCILQQSVDCVVFSCSLWTVLYPPAVCGLCCILQQSADCVVSFCSLWTVFYPPAQ